MQLDDCRPTIKDILPTLDKMVQTRSPEPRSLCPRKKEIRKATEMLYLRHLQGRREEPTAEEIHALTFYLAAERYAYETFLERRISDAFDGVVRKAENAKKRNKQR